MGFTLSINGSTAANARYVGWAPSRCVVRITGMDRLTTTRLHLRNQATAGGGQLVFYASPGGAPRATLALDVGALGGAVEFWVGGKFGSPSKANRDTRIVAATTSGGPPVMSVACMVRVRKDANTLTTAERNRFLRALAAVNNQGNGVFQLFRDMHVDAASREAHFDNGFLPWHRAYLLDLERELQAIDPSVALPYWRFDRAAPKLFHKGFLGTSDPQGAVQFTATNPMRFWVTDTVPGINRRPEFDTATQPARNADPNQARDVITEENTLALGTVYEDFIRMENNPHGLAHVSFGGMISDIGSAARDPLFFLLHCNVDRLWAKWQWLRQRHDVAQVETYADGGRVGHRRTDTMWPWNGVTGDLTPAKPRPRTAPGGGLMTSPTATAPGLTPTVGQMIDYQGRLDAEARLGFDYDDVPYV